MRIIANYPLPISTCRARAGEPVGLLLYPSLESKSYLITPSPGFYRRAEGPDIPTGESCERESSGRYTPSLVLGKPRRKLRISSRATIFKYPRTSKFESPAAPPTSNFKFPATLGVRSLKFSSCATNFQSRILSANPKPPSRELRSPASRTSRRAATSIQTSNFQLSSPATTNPEPPSGELRIPVPSRATNFEPGPATTNPEPPSCELQISSPAK